MKIKKNETLSPKPQALSDDDLEKVTGGVDEIIDTELQNRVFSIIKENLDLNNILIEPETGLVADLGCDSLDLVDLAQTLSEEFGIAIDENSFSASPTVKDILIYISNSVNKLV